MYKISVTMPIFVLYLEYTVCYVMLSYVIFIIDYICIILKVMNLYELSHIVRVSSFLLIT